VVKDDTAGLVGREVHERGAQQDIAGEVESPSASSPSSSSPRAWASVRGSERRSATVSANGGLRTILDRRAVDEVEPVRENLVPRDGRARTRVRNFSSSSVARTRRSVDVVCPEPRHDPVEQEQPLLWEREPGRTVASWPDDRLRLRVLQRGSPL